MTHHTDAELLPCPFCGGKAEAKKPDMSYEFTLIKCQECDAQTDEGVDFEDAAEAWNRRAPAAPVPRGWKLVPDDANMTDEQAEAICAVAKVCGGGAYDIYRAALAAAPQPPEAAPENIREGAPYDNPAFEQLARDMGVWGTPQAALCAQFWLAALAQRVPLSDDQISALFDVHHADLAAGKIKEVSFLTYARVIEAAHGITQEKQG